MKRLFGGILMAVGILIAGASGLCSLMFLFSSTGSGGGGEFGGAGVVLLFGIPPILLGVGMFFAGRALVRSARADGRQDQQPD